jgi:hypothetical protein
MALPQGQFAILKDGHETIGVERQEFLGIQALEGAA